MNRDRGLCHEKLGGIHTRPSTTTACQYLTARPEALDADTIRQRLVNLEQTTTGRSSASIDVPDAVDVGDAGGAKGAGTGQSAELPRTHMRGRSTKLRSGTGWTPVRPG